MRTPTRFWTTYGVGESDVSILAATDIAYMQSGLGYQNHILVSSIPPVERIYPQIQTDKGITLVPLNNEMKIVPFSEVIHVIKAIKTGIKGENLCSCISLVKIATRINKENCKCLLAYESTGKELTDTQLQSIAGLKAMIHERKAKIDTSWGNSGYETISSSLRVSKQFGCSVVFVVFDPFTYKS